MGVTSFHLQRHVGRLIELRPEGLHSVADLAAISVADAELRRDMPGAFIYCVDWRRLRVLSPEVAQALAASMREKNPFSLRSAAVIGEQPTLALQLERVIREARHPSRRVFRDPERMLAWLAEVTTPEEQAQARAFLDALPPSSAEPLSRSPARARPGS